MFRVSVLLTHLPQLISVQVLDDMEPEVPEDFEIHLVETLAEDGLVGSTATSGASIDPLHNTQNISLPESDFPFGLIEFSASEVPPQPGDPIIPPATQPVKVCSIIINIIITKKN